MTGKVGFGGIAVSSNTTLFLSHAEFDDALRAGFDDKDQSPAEPVGRAELVFGRVVMFALIPLSRFCGNSSEMNN
ncbi:MAG: hypothetical protein EX271_08345 [Acidimicrobiales bacterium]|nr:MAG: hypothetical protein EX271_08345 [Acidimicrobiales bacterium]